MNALSVHAAALFKYSFIALPLAFAGMPLYIHAPDLYTRHYGMSIGVIGAILLGIRLFDAIQDPVIGFLSDKFSAYRQLIIYAGAFLLGLGMFGLFSLSPIESQMAWWFGINVVLATTGFSILVINLNMVGALWTDQTHQKTRITTSREALGLLGLLVASAFPSVMDRFLSIEMVYVTLFLTFLVVLVIGVTCFRSFLLDLPPNHPAKDSLGETKWVLLSLLKGQEKRYFLTCFLSYLAASVPAVLVLFVIRDYLNADSWTPIFLITYFIAGVAVMPIWYRLSTRIGKAETWLLSMLLAVATFVWAYALQPGDVLLFAIICVLSGFALGADLALPPSILADRVDTPRHHADAAQYFALLALIPKLALAVATGAAFLLLNQLSFAPGQNNSPDSLAGLLLLYAIVPCLIKLVSAYVLWRDIQFQGGFHANQTS